MNNFENEAPDEMTAGEAAQLLGVSRMHVNRLANAGRIPARQVSGHYWIFKRADIEAYKAQPKPKVGRPKKADREA